MPATMQVARDLDGRLVEIDRTLRKIQLKLLPDREPREPLEARREPPPASRPPTEEETPRPPTEEKPRETERPRAARAGPLASLLQRGARREQPAPEPPGEPPPVPDPPIADFGALTDIHLKLLSATHELLEAYQQTLTQISRGTGPSERQGGTEVTLSAGPFSSIDAVRTFEHALATLPGVRDVAVRGYGSGNRVLIEVGLS
jgi:hypothetical protein